MKKTDRYLDRLSHHLLELDDNGKPLRKKAEMDVVEDYDDDYEDYESESSTISHKK